MAPWPNRLLGATSNNEPGPSTTTPSPSRSRVPSHITEADILENALGIPTLPSPSSPRSKHRHGRSLSHPFPALFASRKKPQQQGDAGPGFESTTTDEDGLSKVRGASPMASTSGSSPKPPAKVPDKDLRTGKCMMCDSMVRWPKELKVFRCTVCLTINDLKPVVLEAREDGQRAVKMGAAAAVAPLSIEKTRRIIDQCITAYLLNRLKHDDGDITRSEDSERRVRANAYTNHHSELPIITAKGKEIFPIRPNGHRKDGERDSDAHSADNNITKDAQPRRDRTVHPKSVFEPLEDYIISSFGALECVNSSFSTSRRHIAIKASSEGSNRNTTPQRSEKPMRQDEVMSELDAKTLLLGDVAENGSWWTGDRTPRSGSERVRTNRSGDANDGSTTLKSPRIDWGDVNEWYYLVLHAGKSWLQKLDDLTTSEPDQPNLPRPSEQEIDAIEAQIMESQARTQRVLLKATEGLLKRPGRPLHEPDDLRFLLIILANPLLYPAYAVSSARERSRSREKKVSLESNAPSKDKTESPASTPATPIAKTNRGSSGKHSGIIKRILGLLSNVPNECHHHLVSWFARYSDGHFQRTTDLIGSFVTYRLIRQNGQKREVDQDPTADLVPNMSAAGWNNTSAALHAALGSSGQSPKKNDGKSQPVLYNDDWQIKAAARVMALFVSANNSGITRKGNTRTLLTPENGQSAGLAARERAHNHGQILPTSDFYNTLLDYSDLVADFEAWEARRGKFTFCQYPFFLSIWAKIQIMEHDARRQMEVKAREAFFDSIMTNKNVNIYLVLKIRRECLVEDSLKGVSEVVGSGGEEIKKGLRIEFKGEEGIDAGGLRKEWFLLLVRDVFNPEHGMFTYDEDSHFCYFNPHSFETTDQFFLVGIVLGLAIYNSTILDVALPPFAFRKLLAAGPATAPGATSHAKPLMTYTLEDLAEYRPALASGLRQLLEFDGDVESIFCRNFVADIERYGQMMQVPLCPDGENIPVTNSNRREFVDLYVRYLLEVAVVRQFEPFKRGFFTVCGGNALSLFRPEEIELLIRGSDEPLDIASLRAVAVCENWKVPNAAETEPVVQWFWESFETANPKDQRKLLSFITGSDRIPAMGATNLVIKLSCLGDDSPRFPVARTCFNMLSLWRYSSRGKLETMLWRAVNESEGFGLK